MATKPRKLSEPPSSTIGDQPDLWVGRTDRLIALRQFPAFASLQPEDVQGFAFRAVERRYSPGERLLNEGEPIKNIAFVVRGEVTVERQGRLLRTYGPRSVVGGVGVLADDNQGYTCYARTVSTVLLLSADEMLDIFEEHFIVARTALRGMASEILSMRRQLGSEGGFHTTEWEAEGEMPAPLDLVGRMAQLRRAMPFAGARLEALADLAREARELRLDEGDALWAEGDDSSSFLVLLWGKIHAQSSKGVQVTFGPGDIVGSLGALGQEKRWFTATCATPVLALRLEEDALLDVMEDHFDFALALIRTLARAQLELQQRVAEQEA